MHFLQDGLDWVPSSTANASSRMLRDGETELVRYYCARRTKTDLAKPHIKPYVIYQRSVYDAMKRANPRATTYEIKAEVCVPARTNEKRLSAHNHVYPLQSSLRTF